MQQKLAVSFLCQFIAGECFVHYEVIVGLYSTTAFTDFDWRTQLYSGSCFKCTPVLNDELVGFGCYASEVTCCIVLVCKCTYLYSSSADGISSGVAVCSFDCECTFS